MSWQKKLSQFGSFEPNAILRGAQLTLVGANRALQNPGLFTSEHYRQAALAVGAGIAIWALVALPVRPSPPVCTSKTNGMTRHMASVYLCASLASSRTYPLQHGTKNSSLASTSSSTLYSKFRSFS